ncbi:alkaline phosphatase family protein [Varibaculum vaginae]|uniref:alkaline phosphatase family protein n=1 Tax=Varibaculum vaginae TaxID=2364797 RepID=UPI000F073EB9|nr:nucleotide pyrophosphatase/phosphodiesterase family protein [Varibaculum vaginae]
MSHREKTLSGMRIWDILPTAFGALHWQEETKFSSIFRQLMGEGKRRLCLVAIDGMGQQLLMSRRGHIPFMRPYLKQAEDAWGQPVRTCVPSTTVAALSSLHTGLSPAETGMLGYQCWDPVARRVLNLITFEGFSRSTRSWSDQPTYFTRARQRDLKTQALVPPDFVGSRLSEITLRDASLKISTELAQRCSHALQAFKQGADYVYLYWSQLDHWGHNHGWSHPLWLQELETVDRALSELRARLPKDVVLVITADHGMVNVTSETTIDLAASKLSSQVATVSGEPRALQVHLKEQYLGEEPAGNRTRNLPKAQVLAMWKKLVAERGQVIADYRRVYGEICDPNRIGDFTIFAKENYQFVDSRFQSHGVLKMVGVHGSLTKAEMEIPLIIV